MNEIKTIEINEQILNQIDRQINLAYWLSGIIIGLAIFIVGYQVYINSKTIKNIKEENNRSLKITMKKLFIVTLKSKKKIGIYETSELIDYLEIYRNDLQEDKEVEELLKYVKFQCIDSYLSRFVSSLSTEKENLRKNIARNLTDNILEPNLVKKEIERLEIENESEDFKKQVVNELIKLKGIFEDYNI